MSPSDTAGGMSMLAALRHDLRTPINQILGYSELLEEEARDSSPASLIPDLKQIQASARVLLGLIDDNLSPDGFAAIAANVMQVETAPADAGSRRDATLRILTDEVVEADEIAPIPGRILVVDDVQENLDLLTRRLSRQGHSVSGAHDGSAALAAMHAEPFDLVLLDVLMPVMDGYEALRAMKSDAELRHIPVIMISALDELASVVRCIEAGAEDYLPKPFEPTLLRARIGASLEKKVLRDQEQRYLRTIEETQQRLNAELREAARYVRSILPEPAEEPLRIQWRYFPSTELGGDSFGYHWIDEDHLAIYLLDVCGHGVGASLLSIAAANLLRTSSLPNVDFCEPSLVLGALNGAFQMDTQNNMYFTIWYAVYDAKERMLQFASAGHPPAVLLEPGEPPSARPLPAQNLMIGAMPDIVFRSRSTSIPRGARLFVFSDGAYEIRRSDGTITDVDDFLNAINEHGSAPDPLDRLVAWAKNLHGDGPLDDDLALLAVDF